MIKIQFNIEKYWKNKNAEELSLKMFLLDIYGFEGSLYRNAQVKLILIVNF